VRAYLVVVDPEDHRGAGHGQRLERLDPARSYVLAVNHQSIYDIPICSPRCRCSAQSSPRASLGSFPFLGWHPAEDRSPAGQPQEPGADIVGKMKRLVGESHT
jgi:hypothetical protein